jgi:hypothetical protein
VPVVPLVVGRLLLMPMSPARLRSPLLTAADAVAGPTGPLPLPEAGGGGGGVEGLG